MPSASCGTCTVSGDCAAPSFPGCVNITCQAGQCVYQALTGNVCTPGNSCYSAGTCSSSGLCVSTSSYLTNATGFGCPNITASNCLELQCVGTGMSPVCTAVAVPAPSPCFTCNNATGVFTQETCPTPPTGKTEICTVTSGVGSCTTVDNGCNVDSDCDAVCGSASLCNVNTCQAGSCVCNTTRTCPNQCWACSIFTNECALLNGHDLNLCGTCDATNVCCDDPVACNGASIVNALGPYNGFQARAVDAVAETLNDDDDGTSFSSGVQVTCVPGSANTCSYTFVVYTSGASFVNITNPANNFVTFNGQLQSARTPPTVIQSRLQSDDDDDNDGSGRRRGTVYTITTLCTTNVAWHLFAFNHWLNISSGYVGRSLIDTCGVCGGDNLCSTCDTTQNKCLACSCTAATFSCRKNDSLACTGTTVCTTASCDDTQDYSQMCSYAALPEGTPCSRKGHDGVCDAIGVCEFFDGWDSAAESSGYPYEVESSDDGPYYNTSSDIAGIILTILLIPFCAAFLFGGTYMWRVNEPLTIIKKVEQYQFLPGDKIQITQVRKEQIDLKFNPANGRVARAKYSRLPAYDRA